MVQRRTKAPSAAYPSQVSVQELYHTFSKVHGMFHIIGIDVALSGKKGMTLIIAFVFIIGISVF